MTDTFKDKKEFYLKTVSGQLILINVFIFVLMSLWDKSLLAPSQSALDAWGASIPNKLARGEYWRFFTANFIHFGLIHLWFNCTALKIVGYQIERLIPKKLFLAIYLLSGVIAISTSAFLNLSAGAGASGAIFGLIGIGVVIEILLDKKSLFETFKAPNSFKKNLMFFLRKRPFFALSIINVCFAIVVNLITGFFDLRIKVDNAAHISGMISGALLFYSFIKIIDKEAPFTSRLKGIIILLCLSLGLIQSISTLSFSNFIEMKYISKGKESEDLVTSYYHYNQSLKINPFNKEALFLRGTAALLYGDRHTAFKDFKSVLSREYPEGEFNQLMDQLEKEGKLQEKEMLKLLISEAKKYLKVKNP